MSKFVWDACVPIGLQKIQFLQKVIDAHRELKNEIFMHNKQIGEVKNIYFSAYKKLEKNKDIIRIYKKYDSIDMIMSEGMNLNLTLHSADWYVLLTAVDKSADFIISMDTGIINDCITYFNHFNKSTIVVSTPYMLRYLHEEVPNIIDYLSFKTKSLELFKYDEIHNIYEKIKDPISNWNVKEVQNKFQYYKDPLIDVNIQT